MLAAANVDTVFKFDTGPLPGADTPQQLQKIDLTSLSNGLSIVVDATQANGGDGKANVGFVMADPKSVKSVTIDGDLGGLDSGNILLLQPGPGLALLSVGSLGVLGMSTQGASPHPLRVNVNGPIGKIIVSGDVAGELINANGQIGQITIRGSLIARGSEPNTGEITAAGSIGDILIGGSVLGGGGKYSGSILSDHSIGNVTVGGSLVGGSGESSGQINAGVDFRADFGPRTRLGIVKIGDSVLGGSGKFSGLVVAGGGIASLTVGGSVAAGTGADSGEVNTGDGGLRAVSVGGDFSGKIEVGRSVGKVTITRNITDANGAGIIDAARISSVKVGGNIDGGRVGAILGMGSVFVGGSMSRGNVGASTMTSLTVVGDVLHSSIGGEHIGAVQLGSLILSRINSQHSLRSLTVNGDAASSNIFSERIGAVHIHGNFTAGSIFGDTIIGSVNIDGSVIGGSNKGASILAARIGQVTVLGDWTGTSIVAGFLIGADFLWGTDDDKPVPDSPPGSISSITIGGTVNGTAADGDKFVFEASSIKSLSVGGTAVALKSGKRNDDIGLGTNSDFRLIEK